MTSPRAGVLVALALFPVKSVAGLRPDEALLEPVGLRGDRGHVLVTAEGTVLTAKTAPLLRTLTLAGTAEDPLLAAPGQRPGDLAAVAAHLGTSPLRLRAEAAGARQVAAVHVVSLAQRADPAAGDSSRANLVVDLDPAAEAAAVDGAHLLLGGLGEAPVRLRLGLRPRHCAGWFAEVVTPGRVRRGAPVQVLAAPG
ncbi:MOSC N-terminal beta barrel domain-containing protein [Kineococcus rubinsiae]|uniref:MOSC N-terminal beta barrel domain-containing protein n=1 Tax=Kineococcus rubinsiae TaxID=2609562 RepID=UPI00142F5FFF|nr:MOSC N-terminal beta barrel domain-containing protein [Kineococcus rubinsiae]